MFLRRKIVQQVCNTEAGNSQVAFLELSQAAALRIIMYNLGKLRSTHRVRYSHAARLFPKRAMHYDTEHF